MSEEKTYLELSEAGGSSHKFYEVTINGTELTIRYGRIGDQGQTQKSSFSTPEKALAEANKKINEKIRKGYERAVMGVRKKRTVTRRAAMLDDVATSPAPQPPSRSRSAGSSSSARQTRTPPPPPKTAPVLWSFNTGSCAYGIFIDKSLCWVGTESGTIFAVNHQGEVHRTFKLPEGVKCIVADDVWLYAGCDDGKVYDLSGKYPHVAYEIDENVDIFWLDIADGVLAVSDSEGSVTVVNHEDESQWTKKSSGSRGWMVRCDEIGVYHGHLNGVTMYDWEDGTIIWDRKTDGAVLFGWQEEATVYAATSHFKVHTFTKRGEAGPVCKCDASVFSCAASPDGKYVFAGDNRGYIYCFDENGNRLWDLLSGYGVALSMQYLDEKLYIVTARGHLACIDASGTAINEAKEGRVPQAVSIQAPRVEEAPTPATVETTTDSSGGVIVECRREGSELRVRVVSEGFNRDWHCQFPKNIREAGARFVVDEVREAGRGGFYRVLGNIRRLS